MSTSPVQIRYEPTPALIELLESVTLGTNGAHYRHLNTRDRIKQADNPIFVSIERRGVILANITFCQRGTNWYIRYFAFDKRFQSSGTKKSKSDNFIKREIESIFQNAFEHNGVESFYAFIDPQNVKSLWMAENYGFHVVSKIATQTFSRVNPKPSKRLLLINHEGELMPQINRSFSNYAYFYSAQTKPPFYALKDESGEIVAFAKINLAEWEIKRLPGKFGGWLTRFIPYIPRLNKIIRPKNHAFVVPDCVWVKENKHELLVELFEGILAAENRNLIIWWIDHNDSLYTETRDKIKWGLLHRLVGISHANVVERTKDHKMKSNGKPVFTAGFDFI